MHNNSGFHCHWDIVCWDQEDKRSITLDALKWVDWGIEKLSSNEAAGGETPPPSPPHCQLSPSGYQTQLRHPYSLPISSRHLLSLFIPLNSSYRTTSLIYPPALHALEVIFPKARLMMRGSQVMRIREVWWKLSTQVSEAHKGQMSYHL